MLRGSSNALWVLGFADVGLLKEEHLFCDVCGPRKSRCDSAGGRAQT